MSGGAIGTGLILDFSKYLNEFDIKPESLNSVSEPGVYYRDFEKETLKSDLIMPVFPAKPKLWLM